MHYSEGYAMQHEWASQIWPYRSVKDIYVYMLNDWMKEYEVCVCVFVCVCIYIDCLEWYEDTHTHTHT